METTRRTFVAGTAAAGIALAAAGTALAKEAKTEETATETGGDGYSVVETESGLQVTIADDENPDLPTVVVLATGGTIAGTGEAGKTTGYSAGQLDVGTLVASAAGITDIANVRGVQVCNVGSDDITDAYWIQMAQTINELAADDAISGFAVTHGTDTLEETAYFLNLAVKTDKPVVITGAMRPSTATSADGPMNLYQTIALAANPDAAGRGAMVVFSDGIYGGRDVQKVNTFKTDAFSMRDMGCLGYMQDNNAYFYNATTKKHTVDTEFSVDGLDALPAVGVAYFTIDADPGVLDYHAQSARPPHMGRTSAFSCTPMGSAFSQHSQRHCYRRCDQRRRCRTSRWNRGGWCPSYRQRTVRSASRDAIPPIRGPRPASRRPNEASHPQRR